MKYIVYGAGAIGGVIGARLHERGHDVALICRGAQLDAVSRDGLTVKTPDGTANFRVPAVAHPSETGLAPDDVIFLAMKSQDTEGALRDLAAVAPPEVAVVCAQNGVDNERMAMRRFSRVYGMLVLMPCTYLEPGVIVNHASGAWGVLDAGCYPAGVDATIERVCADLTAAHFSSLAAPSIMRWKYAKLLANLNNAFVAACGTDAAGAEFVAAVRAEALACYAAAGIDCASDDEMRERRVASGMRFGPVEGAARDGGSSWQSLARGLSTIETDYLNGEIVMLGRLHGVPTPYNLALQIVANRMAREGQAPGSLPLAELQRLAEELRSTSG
ncbi:MAG: 2-dehydropantoate 2-reductase [Dehalococcoidia bacterium]|nr:MAG: 2-dehydropantoate 2-reductase [Dehalococcoidia bacterium]